MPTNTYYEERDFKTDVLSVDLDAVISWVRENRTPGDVYAYDDLEDWAIGAGFIKEDDADQWARENGYVKEG